MPAKRKQPKLTDRKNETRGLPPPGDPLVLASGEIIEEDLMDDQERVPDTQSLSDPLSVTDPKSFRPKTRRVMKDLPGNITTVNAVAVVFTYTMFGISDGEICEALSIDHVALRDIRSHAGYSELFDTILNEFVNVNSDILQSRIAAYSHLALGTIGEIAVSGQKESNRLSASKDLLDRSGARPVDLSASKAAQMNELRIVITKADGDTDINVNFNK